VPQDANLSPRALPEAFEDLHRRGFARAVRPEEREDFSSPHLQIDARDRLAAAVALHQTTDTDHRLGPGRADRRLIHAVFRTDAVHLASQAR